MHDNDVLPINPVSPSRNELFIQGTNSGGPTNSMVLPRKIDGIDTERNAPIPTLENIYTLNIAPIGIREVATHLMPPSQPQQLLKSPISVPQRPVCTQPPIHPTLIVPNLSPHI